MSDHWTEPGRSVTDSGRVSYDWPPVGRFRDLWERFEGLGFSDTEKLELLALIQKWHDENATLVSYTNPDGEWVDVEPDWSVPEQWKEGDVH